MVHHIEHACRVGLQGDAERALAPSDVQAAIAAQREFLASDEMVHQLADFDVDDLATQREAWNTPAGYRSEREILARPQFETLEGRTGG